MVPFENIVSFPSFNGDELESVHEFLDDFNRAATFYELNNEKQALVLPFYLKGNVNIWFKSLPNRNEISILELKEALLRQFASSDYYFRLREHLGKLRQEQYPKLADYIAEVRKCCSRLNLVNTEWIHYLLKGFRKEIRDFVFLKQPKTFDEAENYAKLKYVVMQSSNENTSNKSKILTTEEQTGSLKDRTDAIGTYVEIPHITSHTCQNELNFKSGPSEFIHDQTNSVKDNYQQISMDEVAKQEIRHLVKNEIEHFEAALRSCQDDSYCTKDRGDELVCDYCSKRGHTMSNCWFLQEHDYRQLRKPATNCSIQSISRVSLESRPSQRTFDQKNDDHENISEITTVREMETEGDHN